MNLLGQKYKLLHIKSYLIAFIMMLLFSGCAITLVGKYDEITDKNVTKLQKELETFFITLENQEEKSQCKHKNHTKFYQDARIEISSISVRANAIPNNKITIDQVQLLDDSLKAMEKLHKIGCMTSEQIDNVRSNINTSITAILKVEIAKKRGIN